jgi:hypothetical protein
LEEVTKNEIVEMHGFQDSIGMIDGTHIFLTFKPNSQGKGYFNRKSCYFIPCMIVIDDNHRIIHIFAGFIGASYDT